MTKKTIELFSLCVLLCSVACADTGAVDEENAVGAFPVGKADGVGNSECEFASILTYVNTKPTADAMNEAGVNRRAANNIEASYELCVDEAEGGDCVRANGFTDVSQIDDIPFVGPITMDQLLVAAMPQCDDIVMPPVTCLAIPVCDAGETTYDTEAACTDVECRELSICGSTIWCGTPGAVTCEAVPVCNDSETSHDAEEECPADSSCRKESICGTTIWCSEEAVDTYAQARDVTLRNITFADDVGYPDSYSRASVTGFSLGGTEFWQKWSGGENPTFSFSAGSPAGRRCMQASAIRFETIMTQSPEAMTSLRDNSNWSGRFFNWNDDYTDTTRSGGTRLWAWRTGLIKWISATNSDGSCELPTLEMVNAAAASCQSRGDGAGGEIQGCSAR